MHRLIPIVLLALSVPVFAQGDEPGSTAEAENAQLYILRPNLPGFGYSTFEIYANDELLATIEEKQGFLVQATPGAHAIRIDQSSKHKAYNGHQAKFGLRVSAGVTAIVRCDDTIGQGAHDRDEAPTILTEFDDCSMGGPYSLITEGGVTFCGKKGKPYKKRTWSGSYNAYEDPVHCQLVHDRKLVDKAKMVPVEISLISNDGEAEYRLALEQNTLEEFETFMQDFPESKFKGEARERHALLVNAEFELALNSGTIESLRAVVSRYPESQHAPLARQRLSELEVQRRAAAAEQKMRDRLQRDSMLSLQARKDKYMVILTGHLKNQEFSESLFYFELLDYMNVELSPSFDFFWGEGLLRTGQPELALKKLYTYVNDNGSGANYYTKALELVAEAEKEIGW